MIEDKVSFIGVFIPSLRPSTVTIALIKSISEARKDRWSRSMEGRAFGILLPNSVIYSTGSSNENEIFFARPML